MDQINNVNNQELNKVQRKEDPDVKEQEETSEIKEQRFELQRIGVKI